MEKKLLHTPEGVRDIYNEECARKHAIQHRIHDVLKKYGYRDIETPTFEFFDIFNKESGSVAAKDMYKFFDREGNTLVLRPDMTPSIARSAAKYFMEEDMPIRLCYVGNTFINNSEYQGKLKEDTNIGAELIGDASSNADAEIIAMLIDSMLKTGLQEIQVEIGQVDFLKGLIEETGIEEETQKELTELIENKNYFGLEELLDSSGSGAANIPGDVKEVFLKLPELFGVEALEKVKTVTLNRKSVKAIERLEKLYDILGHYGMQKYVSFDLGMLSRYKYYTGIIFKAYTYGTGDAIATGGRYDALLKQFGKNAASIGFAFRMDRLMAVLRRQDIEIPVKYLNTMILYKVLQCKMAIELAGYFRKTNVNIELIRKSPAKELPQYIEYAKRSGIGGILYIENAENIKVINIGDGSTQNVKLSELLRKE